MYGYPADFSKLAGALRQLAELETGSPVRTGNITSEEFGLDDKAKRIGLKAGDSRTAATVTVGVQRKATVATGWKKQSFIRRDKEESIYLVDCEFTEFSGQSTDWINGELLRVPPDDIVSVNAGGVVLKQIGSEWTLPDLNKDTEQLVQPEADRLRSGLESLGCGAVADPARTDAELGFDKPFTYVAQTKDGFTYTVKLGAKADERQFVRIAVDYTRPAPPVAPEGDDAEKKKAYDEELQEFNSTVAANTDKTVKLNEKVSKWTYVVGAYLTESLQLSRANLVEEKGGEKDAEPDEIIEGEIPAGRFQ
jgi:hypothetical protein